MDVSAWLRGLGLDQYAQAFGDNDIDEPALCALSNDDLKDLGVGSVGHRKKLLAAIAALPEFVASEAPAPAPAPEAERRQLTVMFVDLVGSTALSSKLDPEDLREVLRAYQETCAEAVARFEGHVAKYIGDGLLVYFGYPQAHEDDAQRAVKAGLGIVENVGSLNLRLAEDYRIELKVRVGINTGLVVAGEMGGGATREADAIVGETPNVAARLEGLAKPNTVAISAATHALVEGLFECDDLGPRRLKGISEKVPVYRARGESAAASRFEAAAERGLTPLVGREEEIGLLMKRWEQAQDGEGQVVLLSGEAGVGKSRIVRAFRDRLEGDSHSRVLYYGSAYHRNSALYPAIDQLERALRFARYDGPAEKLDKLEAVLGGLGLPVAEAAPPLASLLSLPVEERYKPPELSPQQLKTKMLEAAVAIFAAMAVQAPVLMVVEDAHWIDPSTVELLSLAIDRLPAARLLLLITFRPEFESPWAGQANLTLHALNRLGRRECTKMVAEVTGGKALPAEVLDRIVAKTDGVPLYVEELTKTVLESGQLKEESAGYVLTGPLPRLAIPDSLKDSLMARLDRLAPVKEVAQLAAIIGRNFSYELLAAASPLSDAEIAGALDKLVASRLVYRRGLPPEVRYEFKHALVRDAAYASLLKVKRQEIHQRIAKVLGDRFPETTEPELLAHHYTEAGLSEQAAGYWHRAGERAVKRSANVEAVAHLQKGIALLEPLPSAPDNIRKEIELHTTLGVALMSIKGYTSPEAERVYERTKELCEEAGDRSGLFAALWGLWMNRQTSVRFESAGELIDQLLPLAEEEQDGALILQAHHAAWTTSFSRGELMRTMEHAEEGGRLYDISKHRSHAARYAGHDPGVCGLNFAAASSWILGYPERARDRVAETLELAQQLEHPISSGLAHSYAAVVHRFRGESSLARAEAKAAVSVAKKHGFVGGMWLALAAITEASILAQEGHGKTAILQARTILKGKGPPLYRPFYFASLAEMCVRSNRYKEALSALDVGLALIEKTGERWWESELHRLKGEVLLAQGGGEKDAATCFRRAGDIAELRSARSLQLRAATSLARLWQTQKKSKEARDLLAPVYGWFTEGFETPDLKDAKALLDDLA